MKRLTSIHLSAHADTQIKALKENMGLTQSEIILLAVDRLHAIVVDGTPLPWSPEKAPLITLLKSKT